MEYQIYVGTLLKIKQGFMKGALKIMYCGMSNDNTFVLSLLITQGYQGFSPTIHYNAHSTTIHIYNRDFDVIEVTPDYIILGD
jgi:hypothetical protein